MLNYERLTELVHLKICELNFELVHIESELSQHWQSHYTSHNNGTTHNQPPNNNQHKVTQGALKRSKPL